MMLWSGQAVSEVGSAITQLALPLTAVVVLRAATFQVGLLTSAATAAFALIALPAGALVDRNVAQVSYRQTVCPPRLLGRMNAATRWIVWGTIPLGGVIGGAAGATLGIRPAVWIAFAGSWAAGWWVFFSPLRAARDIPGDAGD